MAKNYIETFLKAIIIGCFISSINISFAQTNTDSLKKELFSDSILKVYEKERIADSLKRTELEKQLAQLKSTDNLAKQELQAELQALKSKKEEDLLKQKNKIDSLKVFTAGYPVSPYIDTIFFIFNRLGSFTPKERAVAIQNKIKHIGQKRNFNPDSLIVSPHEQNIDVLYNQTILISLSTIDAMWENLTQQELALSYRDKILQTIINHRERTNWKTILKEIVLALIVVAIVFFLIKLIIKGFAKFSLIIQNQKNNRINGIKIRNYEILNADRQINFFLLLVKLIKLFVIVLVVYLALPILFGIFPWTEGLADTLIGYFLNPVKSVLKAVTNYLPNLFTIIVIVFIFSYVLKGIKFLKSEIEIGALTIPGFYPDWASPTYQIIRVLIYAFMLVVIFPYLPGSDSPVFQGVSVFLGVLFTFGSSGSLSNLIAGLVLTYMRAFKVGDRVKIGEVVGDIIEKSVLVTRVRTTKNEIISIPNSNVMNSHTINYSSDAPDKGLIIHTTITIGYDVPWKQVHQLLIDAAMACELIEKEPKPFVLQTSLEDFYVAYQINAYTKHPNKQAGIYSNLHQNIQDKFNQAGVEILSPHYRAQRDGNMVTTPTDYLPKDYQAPSFRVTQTNKK